MAYNFNYFIRKWNALQTTEDKMVLLKKTILFIYINQDLIRFLDKLVGNISDTNQKKLFLLFAKKIINQYPRRRSHHEVKATTFDNTDDKIKFNREQSLYNPYSWIANELEYLEETSSILKEDIGFRKIMGGGNHSEKELLSQEETLSFLNVSKSTLDRRRFEGMPFHKQGRKIYFKKSELLAWMNKNNSAT